ncbi:hypothetical protein HIM_05346 [Hirsutella minnesotensis 3608]|uniref:Uncharacterized protein n=1 Tax=Hirsutella minnesotensis 3608 TaxID=1043627 RepID=A0A0F8A093_9HYPO|nr:hypothetical protein HIM_05346 [Hirsutella minnesotensis 3608]
MKASRVLVAAASLLSGVTGTPVPEEFHNIIEIARQSMVKIYTLKMWSNITNDFEWPMYNVLMVHRQVPKRIQSYKWDVIKPNTTTKKVAVYYAHPLDHPNTFRLSWTKGTGDDALRCRTIGHRPIIQSWIPWPWLFTEPHGFFSQRLNDKDANTTINWRTFEADTKSKFDSFEFTMWRGRREDGFECIEQWKLESPWEEW